MAVEWKKVAWADHNHSGVYESVIEAGAAAQYWRGDKTWQTLNQAAVAGLTIADSPTFAGATLNGTLNLSSKFTIAYNAVADSLDFTYIGP